MDQFMADMTFESRCMAMKWVRSEVKDTLDPERQIQLMNLMKYLIAYSYLKLLWLLTFMSTVQWSENNTRMSGKASQQVKNLKHEQGPIQVWLQSYRGMQDNGCDSY
jgi:hypothetical protein